MKTKWKDMTALNAPAKNGLIDPNYRRVRVWRLSSAFNGLRLPKRWRWREVDCPFCGTQRKEKEYASWRWERKPPWKKQKEEEILKAAIRNKSLFPR